METKKKEAREAEQVSRRDLLQVFGSVPAAAVVVSGTAAAGEAEGDVHLHSAAAAVVQGTYQRKVFDDHQWKTVCVLCNLIIPADERSGSATQAGVPEFLDDWIAFRTEQDNNEDFKGGIFGGLMWLDRESLRLFEKEFADAAPEQQKQILDRIAYLARAAQEDHVWAGFFSQFRNLTITGFFSSKMGIADLPYLGNTAVAEWKGCDPKVWAIIEDRMKNGYKGVLEAKPWNAA
jgi:gluconate 2-dehydrogenase gamma chain